MNTEQAAQQLRLAATILETGHPWEYQPDHYNWKLSQGHCPLFAIEQRFPIRLILATPPDGRPLHNPDNLTAEQVGAGYRLVCYDDKTHVEKLEKRTSGEWLIVHSIGQLSFRHCGSTYRVPLSVPWPEAPKPDPYAELKAAYAEGKTIQVRPKKRTEDWHEEWQDCVPEWLDGYEYRIKPEPFQLPPPPPGMQWHRKDGWREGDLPQGWRPLTKNEKPVLGEDECVRASRTRALWGKVTYPETQGDEYLLRTRRPLAFEHAGKTWTWHRPGDPMPCDGAKICVLTVGLSFWARIIGWRYADEKKTVPLGPEDVKPFTVIRRKGEAQTWHWRTVSYVDAVKVTCGNRGYGWIELASSYERNESLPLTGKWDPSAWEPCSKQI